MTVGVEGGMGISIEMAVRGDGSRFDAAHERLAQQDERRRRYLDAVIRRGHGRSDPKDIPARVRKACEKEAK